MRDIRFLKNTLKDYYAAAKEVEDVEVLYEFYREGEATAEDVDAQYALALDAMDALELKSTLSAPEDNMSAILEVNSGAGGTEACDWAEMLYRMYAMWGEKNGYKVRDLNYLPDGVAGISSATLEFDGDLAFGMLKGENGVHRLVRISPFNAQGKRQTSFASVYVYPLIDNTINIDLKEADVTMETFRSSGAGGQHVNKTESAVRLRHAPSGIVVECQEERSQHANRDKAMQMLRSKLYEEAVRAQNAERDKIEAGKRKIEWGSQVRSYVLDKNYIKDHRSGLMKHNPDAVLDGDLNDLIKHGLLHHDSAAADDDEL